MSIPLLIHMPLWCGQGQCHCIDVLLKLFHAQILLIFIAEYVSECLLFLIFCNNKQHIHVEILHHQCACGHSYGSHVENIKQEIDNSIINSECHYVRLFAVLTFAPENL